jgi:hypothetical protein
MVSELDELPLMFLKPPIGLPLLKPGIWPQQYSMQKISPARMNIFLKTG